MTQDRRRATFDLGPALEPGDIDRGTLTIEETSKRLGLSTRAVRRAILTGEVKAIRIGRRWLVLRRPLESLLERGDTKPEAPA